MENINWIAIAGGLPGLIVGYFLYAEQWRHKRPFLFILFVAIALSLLWQSFLVLYFLVGIVSGVFLSWEAVNRRRRYRVWEDNQQKPMRKLPWEGEKNHESEM